MPSSWWSGPWWSPTFAPPAGGIDLLGALRDQLAADPTIAAACGDRVYTTAAPPGGTVDPATGLMAPYVVLTEVWATDTYNTTDSYLQDVGVQVAAFVPADPDLCEALAKRIHDRLAPKRGYTPVVFADGQEVVRLPSRMRFLKEPGPGPGIGDVWQGLVEATVTTSRTL